jgi:hypothetical protein
VVLVPGVTLFLDIGVTLFKDCGGKIRGGCCVDEERIDDTVPTAFTSDVEPDFWAGLTIFIGT